VCTWVGVAPVHNGLQGTLDFVQGLHKKAAPIFIKLHGLEFGCTGQNYSGSVMFPGSSVFVPSLLQAKK